PAGPCAAAGKAASLLTGGDVYVARIVSTAARDAGDPPPIAVVDAALARARAAAADALRPADAQPRGDDTGLDRLQAVWARLWDDIEAAVAPGTRDRLRGLAMR